MFFDTADVYGQGESERLLGQSLGGRSDELVVATKFGLNMRGTNGVRRRDRASTCVALSMHR